MLVSAQQETQAKTHYGMISYLRSCTFRIRWRSPQTSLRSWLTVRRTEAETGCILLLKSVQVAWKAIRSCTKRSASGKNPISFESSRLTSETHARAISSDTLGREYFSTSVRYASIRSSSRTCAFRVPQEWKVRINMFCSCVLSSSACISVLSLLV